MTDAYARDERGDEFVAATTVGDDARIRPQDSVIAFNFRPDRMRQLTEALAPKVARYTTLTEYEEGWPWPVAFPPRAPGDDDDARHRARPAASSCTSPRPRSTPT